MGSLWDTRRTTTLAKRTGDHSQWLGIQMKLSTSKFFYNEGWNVALVSHVDDLVIGGTPEDPLWVRESLKEIRYQCHGHRQRELWLEVLG